MSDCHVALLTPWDREGGIAKYSERFAAALREADTRVTPVPIEKPGSANPLEFVSLLDQVPDDSDVIHVQFEAGVFGQLGMSGIGAPAFFLALSRVETPVIVTLHEVHAEHVHRGTAGDYLLRGRDFLIERLALRAANATLVHTAEARDVLRERHGDESRIERMLHPADADADPMPSAEAKAELGVERPIALTFGFVEEKKRYEDVVRVLPEFPNLTYVIAGGFRESEGEAVLERVRELANELGVADRVQYIGYVDEDEVPVVFSAADIVVLPYERLSQSGVVNDALAYRRPVVASSLPAFEELRSEFECLVTYDSDEELSAGIDACLYDNSTREQLADAAETYIQEVNWNAFADRTSLLYKEIRASKCSSPEVANIE